MARPPTPKIVLDIGYAGQIVGLFGTQRNAYDKLRLERDGVTWEQFRNALYRQAEPTIIEKIEDCWRTYRAALLRGGLRQEDGFTLPDDPED